MIHRSRLRMTKKRAIVALLLLVPAPSIGALCAMAVFPDSSLGKVLFMLSKIWLFSLPLLWLKLVEKGQTSLSPLRKGGLLAGLLSGCAISGIILLGYLLMAESMIDREFLVGRLRGVGLGAPRVYLCGAVYWIAVNSVLEEYTWRWFCVKQCEHLFRPMAAVVCSALFFTIHHIVAMRVYFDWPATSICALGVFVGGTIWSAMYIRYRSIWPGYLSHAIVDLCIFGLGAWLLFGPADRPTPDSSLIHEVLVGLEG